MLEFLRTTNRCFVYMPVRIERGEMLSLVAASGFELQSDADALWISTECEPQDVFAGAGERFRIVNQRHVVASADRATTVVVSGDATRATRIDVVRPDGERVGIYPPEPEREREPAIRPTVEPVSLLIARVFPALAAIGRLIGSGG